MPRLVEFVQQQCQRALEDGRYVAVRDAVSQQVLRFAQLLVRFTGDGELDFVSFRGKCLDRGDVLPRLVKGQRNLATCGDLNRVRLGGEVWRLARNYGRLRPQCCDDHFDLPLALVPRRSKHPFVIVRGQVRRKQTDRREVQRAVGEKHKDARPLPSGASRLDSQIRGVFGEVQDLSAVSAAMSRAVACRSSAVSRLTSFSRSASESSASFGISIVMLLCSIVVSTPCRCARL